MNIIVRKDKPLNRKVAKGKFKQWMNINYGLNSRLELHYKNIQPKIIATKYMENIAGDLFDYKVFCFGGEPKYIQLIEGRFSETRMAFYDLNWLKTNFTYKFHVNYVDSPQNDIRPAQLDLILSLSRKLSRGFAFVRIDWYLIGENIVYFGEMTFTPEAGIMHWKPDKANELLGNFIELPKEKYIIE